MARNQPFTALGKRPETGLELINSDEPDQLPIGHNMDIGALVTQNVERIRQQSSLLQEHAQRRGTLPTQ